MNPPAVLVNDITYLARQVGGVRLSAPVPGALRSWAEWQVVEDIEIHQLPVGWIARDPGGHEFLGTGPFACFVGGITIGRWPYGPPLTYVSNCRSTREGARLAGQAWQAWQDAAAAAERAAASHGWGGPTQPCRPPQRRRWWQRTGRS